MKTRLSIAAAVLGVATLVGGVAWACVPGARITLKPASGKAGDLVTVTGSTFDPQGSLVNIYWDGTRGPLMGQATVQPNRSFNFSFTVPGDAKGGSHVVSATQRDKNGLDYNPVNAAFSVSGDRAPNRSVSQGAAQAEQPDGASVAPATQPGAPAQAAAPRVGVPAQAAAPAQSAAQPGAAAPGPAVGTQAGPQAPPPAPTAESQQAAAQQPAGSQEAFRTPVPAPAPAGAGEAVSSSSGGGVPAWLLAPLALLSLGFLGAGSGIFLRERKRTRVTA